MHLKLEEWFIIGFVATVIGTITLGGILGHIHATLTKKNYIPPVLKRLTKQLLRSLQGHALHIPQHRDTRTIS